MLAVRVTALRDPEVVTCPQKSGLKLPRRHGQLDSWFRSPARPAILISRPETQVTGRLPVVDADVVPAIRSVDR